MAAFSSKKETPKLFRLEVYPFIPFSRAWSMIYAPRSFAMGRFCFALIKPLRHGFAVPLPGLRLPASASLSLASCWPLPQQLLPVSAAGGGRRRCPQRESHWQDGKYPADHLKSLIFHKK